MTLDLKLGINMGFANNKYPEPHVWTRIVAEEMGLKYVQFVADLLNVYLPDDIVQEQTEQIIENADKYGLSITSSFLSSFTRVNHFMHPDAKQRQAWLAWFKKVRGDLREDGRQDDGRPSRHSYFFGLRQPGDPRRTNGGRHQVLAGT
ncbi:apurinic/apyrimidinic endonuclease family protein [Cohnella rhizosphaerae]|uniref:Sugar phosphate isomerase/epimerase n=1 Tax=Cohnella rhizosphaerae TaxID=1457232 RepID=A0A9X4KYP0_9BACL|nr:hypothetical protein [Cohnella rhizosphaerae]MDG0813347.1 sugar phosphate isomerase/epimerase [Cohnella rhizosphaerae]